MFVFFIHGIVMFLDILCIWYCIILRIIKKMKKNDHERSKYEREFLRDFELLVELTE